MDIRYAEFIRVVAPDELTEDLVCEAKAYTWDEGVEVALVRSVSGERLLISGGRDGINFETQTTHPGCEVLVCDSLAQKWLLDWVFWHTHPRPTGPSDGDRSVIQLLGQDRSRIYEFGGEEERTTFGPNKQHPDEPNR